MIAFRSPDDVAAVLAPAEKAFQALMKPVYAGVEQQVGKEFMDRLTAAAQAAK